MKYRRKLNRKGRPMAADYENMPNSRSAVELQIEDVSEEIENLDMHDKETGYSTQEVEYWEKHRGWYFLLINYPNDDHCVTMELSESLLTSDNTMNGAYFWKTPEEALHFILADCDLPRKQQVFKGYNICRICGPNIVKDEKGRFLHHEILWEAPANLSFPVVPCLDRVTTAA